MLAFAEPCVGIMCTCFVLLRPVILRVRSLSAQFFYRNERHSSQSRFAITVDDTKNKPTGGSLSVPIFLERTREKFSTFSSTVRSGLSGLTVVFSAHHEDSDRLEDWELRSGRGKTAVNMTPSSFLTHPWSLSTFAKFDSPKSQSVVNIVSVEKPLPPLPLESEVSSLSGDILM